MKNMARLFGDTKTNDSLQQSGLKGIHNKRDRELCGSKMGAISVPANATQEVYTFVNRLFKIQYDHAGKCGAIFKMLFDIQRDKTSGRSRISLSSNIIKKGFSEIEHINTLARKLLIDYYSNCEETYVKGMGTVLTKTSPSQPIVPGASSASVSASASPSSVPVAPGTTPVKI